MNGTAKEWWNEVAQNLKEMGWQPLYPPQDPQHRLAKGPAFVVVKEIVQHIADALTDALEIGRIEGADDTLPLDDDEVVLSLPVHYTWGGVYHVEMNFAGGQDAAQRIDRLVRFPLGRLFYTPGVLNTLTGSQIYGLLARHLRGDWSEMDAYDRRENEHALLTGERVFSAYTVRSHGEEVRVWVITEADRSATTVLLPEEY